MYLNDYMKNKIYARVRILKVTKIIAQLLLLLTYILTILYIINLSIIKYNEIMDQKSS